MTNPMGPLVDLSTYNPERVLVPGGMAAQAHAVGQPTEHERTAIKAIIVLTLAAVLAAKGRDWLKLAKGWERDGRFDRAAFDREITKAFTEVFAHPMVPLLSGMLQLGRKSLVDSLDIDIVQRASALKAADVWARKYAEEVARDYGAQSALAVSRSLPEWLNKRLPASALANRAKDLYGLDPRSALSVENYASGKKLTRDMSLRGLAERYLEQRADVMARVQTFTALNFGRQMVFAEAVGEGIIPVSARKVWVTALDEKVCEMCGPMDGVAVPILDRFTVLHPTPKTSRGTHRGTSKLVIPPVHPNCRCTVVLDKTFTGGIITRTVRYEDKGAKHLARLASEAKDMILR